MVCRVQLTYDEKINLLDLKFFPTKRMGYSLKPDIYQISYINNTLKNVLPDNVVISVSINEKIYESNLKINQTLIFTNKSFFYTILGFTQSHSNPLDDIDGFSQLIAGSYKSDKPINITRIDKVHLNCDCIDDSIVFENQFSTLLLLTNHLVIKYTKNQESNFLKN